MFRGRRAIYPRARISRGSLRMESHVGEERGVFFERMTATLIDARGRRRRLLSSVTACGRLCDDDDDDDDALSDFAAVRIGSFGTDIVYPGKLTAGSQRGREKETVCRERRLSPRGRAMRSIGRALRCNYSAIGGDTSRQKRRPRFRTCN